MKKSIAKTMLLVMIVVVSVVMVAQISKAASIANSKHDLSSLSSATIKNNETTQICVFCHTPHFASASNATPLWNRSISTASYTLYSSESLVATMGQPAGVSAACLSCHDGTVAFDALLNKAGSGSGAPTYTFTAAPTKMMTGAATLLGTSLANDHPISFTYVASAKLNATTTTGTKVTVGTLPLYGGKLECASCHNVHDPGVDGATAPFLRATNAGSALCLTCHIK